ncbi:MAG: ABC transporter ATP-binding protein [Ancrocorticia sp.]
MAVIDASGIRKAYGKNTVLDGVGLTLEEGESVAILGPNGAGKTTTIEILMGFLSRDAGEVSVLGADPSKSQPPQWRARIGMAIQTGHDHPKWRVIEFLNWIHAHYDPSPQLRTVDEVLDLFDLAEHAKKPLLKLSGGLRRRVDLAAAVMNRPELLVLDEPTTGLDPAAKRAVHDVVADQMEGGTSLLLTTHDLAEADRLASRILILDEGRIIADGSPQQLREQVESMVEVTWMQGGSRHLHVAAEPEGFVRDLLVDRDVTGLEVRRTSLEDAYLALVNREKNRPSAWMDQSLAGHDLASDQKRDGATASSGRE